MKNFCDALKKLSLPVQAHGVSLDMAQLVVIGTSAVLAALSAAAIPSAGLVTMVMVMQASPHCKFCKASASCKASAKYLQA